MSKEDKQKLRKYQKSIIKQKKYCSSLFLYIVKKISRTNLNFDETEVKRSAFHNSKYSFEIWNLSIWNFGNFYDLPSWN